MGLHIVHADDIIDSCSVKGRRKNTALNYSQPADRLKSRDNPLAASRVIVRSFARSYRLGYASCTKFEGLYFSIAAKGMKHRENGGAMASA
jgi:hypothetical protein